MVTDSISLGSIWLRLLRMIPSITINGALGSELGKLGLGMEFIPRIWIVVLSLPGSPPPFWRAMTPDTWPAREFVILSTGALARSEPLTELIAPVISDLFCVV